jgi:hypothetical protein
MQRNFLLSGLSLVACSILCPIGRCDPDISTLLTQIKAVGREGAGNVEASQAWRELVRSGPESLPLILSAMDGADARVANWLRVAVDTVADRAAASGKPLPAKNLEAFVLNKQHDGAARRLAYEWLTRIDPKTPGRLLPNMLDDPSVDLRRDAVARVLEEAQARLEKKDRAGAAEQFRKALTGARDKDQVSLIAKQLKGLGAEIDLTAHFGFIRKWMIIGPFDNSGEKGFAKAYPPEKAVDLAASYPGKNNIRVSWREQVTQDPFGLVDLNKGLGKHMGAVGYAYAAIFSPTEQPIEIRAGSNNAVKIFLNGKLLVFREEYHHGMEMDQHAGAGTLNRGRNEILIKVCQNEQKEDWAQTWSFQLRVCDSVGGAVPLAKSKLEIRNSNSSENISAPDQRKAEQ